MRGTGYGAGLRWMAQTRGAQVDGAVLVDCVSMTSAMAITLILIWPTLSNLFMILKYVYASEIHMV